MVGKSHIQSVRWGVPVREDTCPEPSAFEVEWPVPFLAAFISPVFLPGPQFAAGWTVSERQTIGSRWVPSRGLRHSRQAL